MTKVTHQVYGRSPGLSQAGRDARKAWQANRASNSSKSKGVSGASTGDAPELYPDLSSFFSEQLPLEPAAEQTPAGQKISVAVQTDVETKPVETEVSDVPGRVDDQLAAAIENAQKADPAVVKTLKKSAFFKAGVALAMALFFAAAVATAVAAAAATVAVPGGVLLIPIAVLLGIAFMVAVSDAALAFYNWNSKKKGGDELPMKADSIGNLLYLVTYCIKYVTGSEREISDNAKKYIHYASSALHLAIYLAPVVLSWVTMGLTLPALVAAGASGVVATASTTAGRTLTVFFDAVQFLTDGPVGNARVHQREGIRPSDALPGGGE